MKPKYIISSNLKPILNQCRWIGVEDKYRALANSLSLNTSSNRVLCFYLSEDTVNRLIKEGKAIKMDSNKLLALFSMSNDPINILNNYIEMEE